MIVVEMMIINMAVELLQLGGQFQKYVGGPTLIPLLELM